MQGSSIRSPRKTVTQQQIAAATHLSLATVSAVLSGKANLRRIAPETVEQVWAASSQLGYQPPIRTHKTENHNIGIILRRGVRYALSNPFYGEIYEGIEEVLTAEDFHPIFSHPFDNPVESAGLPRIIAQGKVAGLILLGQLDEGYIQRLLEFRAKLVTVNFENPAVPSMVIDGVRENQMAMDYLRSQGHRRVAYLSSGSGTQYSMSLERGYRHGLPDDCRPLVLSAGGGDMEHGHQAISQYLGEQGTPSFTCLLAENDTLAAGAILAMRSAGLQVPEQMSVMGGQDLQLPYPLPVKITTTSVDKRYMGRMAVRLLLDSLGAAQNSDVRMVVQASVIVRESVARIG